MGIVKTIVGVDLMADLANFPGDTDKANIICTLGAMGKGDGRGAMYYWDPDTLDPTDTTAYNTVRVTGVNVGAWKKVFTRRLQLPHGILFINNGKREFICTTTTIVNAGSQLAEATIYLTMDNTATGLPIFTSVLFDVSKANIDVTNINDAVGSCRKLLSADNKVLTHIFYRGASSALTVLGVTVVGFRNAVANTSVTFKVEGE